MKMGIFCMTSIMILCLSSDWGNPGFENKAETVGKLVPSSDLITLKLNETAKRLWNEMLCKPPTSLMLSEKENIEVIPIEFAHEGSDNPLNAYIMKNDDRLTKERCFRRYASHEENYTHDNSRYRAVMFSYEFDNATPSQVWQMLKSQKNTFLPTRVTLYNVEHGVETVIKTIHASNLLAIEEENKGKTPMSSKNFSHEAKNSLEERVSYLEKELKQKDQIITMLQQQLNLLTTAAQEKRSTQTLSPQEDKSGIKGSNFFSFKF